MSRRPACPSLAHRRQVDKARGGAGRCRRRSGSPRARRVTFATAKRPGTGRGASAGPEPAETGLEHRPVADGQRVAGIYRRSVTLASGGYAMLDDGMGFSLVPWKPVIEQRLGQQLAATVHRAGVSWDIGRQRGASIY
ncbi:DUF3363 domain-containing protein [Cupriavidus sp. CV2]|nr:DUF3363 domain-containing protein [Cupriavidus sp. CV2]